MQDANGIVIRNKVRLVSQEYSQVDGIDYGETYASFLILNQFVSFLLV
jgi:hypothetical protein